VVITLVVGVGAGVAISLLAGARREATVVDRYYAKTIPYDFELVTPPLSAAQVRSLPGVVRADPNAYVAMVWRAPDGTMVGGINGLAFPGNTVDPTIQLLAGHFAAPGDDTGVVVNQAFVEQFHAHVGDAVDAQTFAQSDIAAVNEGAYDPHGPRYRFHVTGIVRTPDDVTVDRVDGIGRSTYGSTNSMYVPYEWYARHRHEFLDFGIGYSIQLAGHARERAAFDAALRAALPKGSGPPFYDTPRFEDRRSSLQTPVGMETTVLLIVGIAIASGVALVTGLLVRAEQRVHNDDGITVRTLGATRLVLGMAAVLRGAGVGVVGALVAAATAVALSARYPIGIGRVIELDRGVQINAAVVGVGALAVAVGVLAFAFAFAFGWRSRAGSGARPHRTRLAEWLSRVGAPNDVVVGTHFAFERRTSSGSFPSRQAVTGGAVALVGVFVHSVDHVYESRPAHGWSWDVAIGNVNFKMKQPTVARLLADRRLATRTVAGYGQATLGGASREVLAFDPTGTAPPAVLHGRLPRTDSEIAIGAHLLNAHTHIGSTIDFTVADGEYDTLGKPTQSLRLTIVGVALPPIFGESDLGDVSVVTFDAITRSGGDTTPEFVLARLAGNRAATAAEIRHDYNPEMLTNVVPARVVNLHRVRTLPIVGAIVAGVLAIILVAFTLMVSVRLRTRELGTLRALGLPARRLTSVLSWQGVALTITLAIVGIPIGLLGGVALWRFVAHQLGIGDTPTLPSWIGLLVPAALVVAAACSLLPARRARRANVGALLRAE
jgi:hypothetical protein